MTQGRVEMSVRREKRILAAMTTVILLLTVAFFAGCVDEQVNEEDRGPGGATTDGRYDGKRILYIDSYHTGYEWSDGVADGIEGVLESTGVDYREFEMDTKNNPSESFKNDAAAAAKAEIEEFDPDVVITSDDNAFKYIVNEYYRDAALPFVFCGVNWDVSVYDGPYTNTAGMVEVALVPQLLDHLGEYAAGNRVGYIAANTTTAIKEGTNYKSVFGINLTEHYVDTFEEWKTAYDEIQTHVDILIVGNNAGMKNWDASAARNHVETHTVVPTGSIYDFMAEFSLLSIAKDAKEQGQWAAHSALEIIDGKEPAEIGVVRNERGLVILNFNLADRLDVAFDPVLIKYAQQIID